MHRFAENHAGHASGRRGFTLIELSIAMVIGIIVVFAATSMFQAIQRADIIAEVRANEIHQLRRTQAVVSRAMGSLLVMSRDEQLDAERAREARDRAEQGMLDGEPVGGSQGGDGEDVSAGQLLEVLDAQAESYRPRLTLEPDSRLEGISMVRRVRIGETALGDPEPTTPQRLEVALSAPSVVPSYEDERRRYRIAKLGLVPIDVGSAVDEIGAVRGAFVFRDEQRVNGLGLRIFSFWWHPVAGDAIDALAMESARVDPALIDGAVQLIDEVVWGRWRFYKKREWREEFQVLGELDLAAYGELELTTAQNHTVSWLFELAWTIGVDPDEEAEGDEEGEAEAGDSQTGDGGATESGGVTAGEGMVN